MISETELLSTTDAQVWAQQFMLMLEENPAAVVDESLMISWFSNAMMTMHDRTREKYEMVNRHNVTMDWILRD